MNEDVMKRDLVFEALRRALEAWVRHGNEQPLTRWLTRELDKQGVPIRLPIVDWPMCVESVLKTQSSGREWPKPWAEPITRLIQATCWFTHRNGLPVTGLNATKPKKPADWISLKSANGQPARCGDRTSENIVSTMNNSDSHGALPEWAGSKRVVGVLRPGWPAEDDLLAIDHRKPGALCDFELYGAGQSWLGPAWGSDLSNAGDSTPRPQTWFSSPTGSVAEWAYRAEQGRVTQTALILAGCSLALLSIILESRIPYHSATGMSVSLAPGVLAGPCEGSRGILLKPSRRRGSAQVLPIGLPSLPYPTERGNLVANEDMINLKQAPAGRLCWLPLLVSWDPRRHRKPVHWRALSISEQSRNVSVDRAFAARVSWGRDETYVIYRSFAKPAPCAFLGHQTTSRLLVGRFTPEGAVEPILMID